MLLLWSLLYLAELLLTFGPFWLFRRVASPLLIMLILLSTVLILPLFTPLFKIVISILAAYRIVNLLRVMKGRMHRYYLQYVSRRTSFWIAGFHIISFLVLSMVLSYIDGLEVLQMVAVAYALLILMLVFIAARNIRKLAYDEPSAYVADRHLPTVTVAIPARNETRDLELCLKSLLKSDYPKLEIIVYDDCSHAATSDIIKKFAHDGVRFIRGEQPDSRWLAKNLAYQSLLTHATGELIMFSGVDVRVDAHTVRNMINTMYARRKRMLSVLPVRQNSSIRSIFIQPLRYWWELVPPRRFFNRPPVLSTCWIIDREFINSLGGFSSISHTILPEVFFAKKAVESDAYSFIRSNNKLGLMTAKELEGQRSTAVRVKYPQLRRRLEYVIIISWFLLSLLIVPLLAIIMGIIHALPVLIIVGIFSYGCLLIVHALVLLATDAPSVWKGLVTFPIAWLMEIYLGYLSMYQYEFGSVEWKGRNICIPVMHVYPKLPDISR